MTRICAWCKKKLPSSSKPIDPGTTHGICQPCSDAAWVSYLKGLANPCHEINNPFPKTVNRCRITIP